MATLPTTTFMQNHPVQEELTHIDLVGDIDAIDESKSEVATVAQEGNSHDQQQPKATNPRVQFLRLASIAKTRRGPPGLVPPFQPAAPSLLRPVTEPGGEPEAEPRPREPSPLRNLLLTNCSTSSRRRMPHAVNMPQSGFQALILCGPGIGLSTFTSVPSDFPKALVEIANRPMIWYILDWCYRMGVTDITLITPPASKATIAAALAQNPFLTSLPSPTPDLLAPEDLEHTTPTAELLRLPEVQDIIKSDFMLLPCDLICDISGDNFLEIYLTSLGSLGGTGMPSDSDYTLSKSQPMNSSAEKSGRHGGLSVWYNTAGREESVKKEECDFMCTTKLDSQNTVPLSKQKPTSGQLRNLVWTMPMSELWDQCEEDKSWKIRQSLMRKHGSVKCMTQYRDSGIYLFPHWVKDFAKHNEEFESVSEDLVGTWAKMDWRKPSYRARYAMHDTFPHTLPQTDDLAREARPIEDEIDLLSLSSTQVTRQQPTSPHPHTQSARLASRVQANPEDSILSDTTNDPLPPTPTPEIPPILAYILPSAPTAPLVRRVDTTPLLLSVSLLLAKTPSIEESSIASSRTPTTTTSPFAHPQKVSSTATIAPRVTISRSDCLIGANAKIATQCVVKNSVVGANVELGQGCRVTGCVVMEGTVVGEKCVLTGTVVGKRCVVGKRAQLTGCEVQDGNVLGDGVVGKGEKYLVGGLEDDNEGMEMDEEDEEEGEGEDGGEGLSLGDD